ncbi:MAG: hypothetical protein J6K12_03880 [Clostridia bacterium]|nr:hypothetical protein [Clostridia bacterium]
MASPMVYKGRPVVRDGNKVYFGEPYNKYMVVLTVLENVNELPSRILVQLQSTDPALAMTSEKIIKEVERKNLYDAFELGSVWLEKQLAE